MSEQVEEKAHKSLYERIIAKGKEALKGVSDVIARSRDKRAFKSAFDNALDKHDKALQRKNELYENLGKYSDKMEDLLSAYTEIRQAEITMKMLQDGYKEVFNEDMPREE